MVRLDIPGAQLHHARNTQSARWWTPLAWHDDRIFELIREDLSVRSFELLAIYTNMARIACGHQ